MGRPRGIKSKDSKGKQLSVQLLSLEIRSTYSGLLEGTKEGASVRISARLKRDFPTDAANNGHALLLPESPTLPNWQCTAYLEGPALDPSYDVSRLKLCWFVDDVAATIPELIHIALAQVNWDERAKSFDWL